MSRGSEHKTMSQKYARGWKLGFLQVHVDVFYDARMWGLESYFGKTYMSLVLSLGFVSLSIWIDFP